jgi:hypothetical protein
MAEGKSVEDIMAMNNLEQVLLDRIGQDEPYCVLLDQCIVTNFVDPACQPQQCPFRNQAACQYLTSCLNPSLQKEYEQAIRKVTMNTTATATRTEAEPVSETKQNPTKKKKTWGF